MSIVKSVGEKSDLERAKVTSPFRLPRPTVLDRMFRVPPYTGFSILSVLVALLLWEGAVRVFGIKPILLPPPSAAMRALIDYVVAGKMFVDVLATMRRVVLGLAPGFALGVVFGLLIGWSALVRAILNPLISIVFPIPKIALMSLFLIWFGLGDMSKVVLIGISVFFVILTNTIVGVESVPPVVVMAARNMGATKWQVLLKVLLPGSVPTIVASLRISFSIALILVIASEMIVSSNGIGRFISDSGQLLQTERVFAGLALTGILGLICYRLLDGLESKLLPWRKLQNTR